MLSVPRPTDFLRVISRVIFYTNLWQQKRRDFWWVLGYWKRENRANALTVKRWFTYHGVWLSVYVRVLRGYRERTSSNSRSWINVCWCEVEVAKKVLKINSGYVTVELTSPTCRHSVLESKKISAECILGIWKTYTRWKIMFLVWK